MRVVTDGQEGWNSRGHVGSINNYGGHSIAVAVGVLSLVVLHLYIPILQIENQLNQNRRFVVVVNFFLEGGDTRRCGRKKPGSINNVEKIEETNEVDHVLRKVLITLEECRELEF